MSTKPKPIQPTKLAHLQKLYNARVMLVVNGVLTSEQSRVVRRKIMRMLESKSESIR